MAKEDGELSSQARNKMILDRAGRSPLHYAAGERDADHIRALIQEGADVNLADKNGWTPLHFAAQSNNAEIGRLLLDSGALVDPRDGYGNTPLSTAVFSSRGNGEMIGLLRTRGANPISKNDSGVSPLRLARTIANYNVAQFFEDLPDER